ncbi:hypothetical protein PSAL_009770 [Pseudooceanicola algae]|uniref:Uncharacterized protein n=2 Tax=Pseudooceanicola algae TaxID=1537215 RepID=A0A418SEF8_9RHOB|nr:hypothetical protein PSAL_009770 [Pseudooceanicola algae]
MGEPVTQAEGAGPQDGLSETARDRSDRIEEALRDRICMLDYPPGQRLSEAELAAEFGISRTPLRRVLARLEAEGLVDAVHGVGTFVTDLADDALDQIYHLRIALCILPARLDPRPPSPALCRQFRALAARAAALPADPTNRRDFARLILDFILAQGQLSANRPLMQMTRHLYLQTARIWIHSLAADDLDLAEEIAIFAREAEDVCTALQAGDLEAAASIHRAHVSMSFRRILARRQRPAPPDRR